MSDTLTGAAPAPTEAPAAAPNNKVAIGDREYVIQRPSARKASTAFRLLKAVSGVVKDVTRELGKFERDYAEEHSVELTRAQARMRYGPQPILTEDGGIVLEPDELPPAEEGGDPRPNPNAGKPRMMPSPLDTLSEADWEKSGNVLRLPIRPTIQERIGAVFGVALEQAEDQVYRLLALFTLSNEEVARHRKAGTLEGELEARADELLDDGYADEVLELAVAIAEVVDDQFRRRAGELGGGRLGKLLAILGLEARTTQEAPQTTAEAPQTTSSATSSSSSTPTSSTDSGERSNGGPTSPSTPTTASSSPSAPASTTSDT